MKKLYGLKSWYSLEDAAERLTSSLQEPVSTKDIEQLVSEAHLIPSIRVCEIGFTREELESFEARFGKISPQNDNLHPKGLDSLLKLVIGMAVDAYGYDPKASRSPIPREIAASLDSRGLHIDEDTVRKWLNQAKELHDISLKVED